MKAWVIMQNDYPAGVHLGTEQGAEQAKERLLLADYQQRYAHQMSIMPYRLLVHWRVYEFEASHEASPAEVPE